jgi:hypothetical protein
MRSHSAASAWSDSCCREKLSMARQVCERHTIEDCARSEQMWQHLRLQTEHKAHGALPPSKRTWMKR